MPSRSWSIRAKIIALSAVPLTALLALWAFATTLTAGPALSLLSSQMMVEKVGDPGEIMVAEIQRERRLSVELLAGPRAGAAVRAATAALAAQRTTTDQAAAAFLASATGDDVRRAAGATAEAHIEQLGTDLASLGQARQFVDGREVDVIGAQNFYNGIVDTAFRTFTATAGFGEERIDQQIRALSSVGQSREHLSRVDSLLAGAYAAGRLTPQSRADILQGIATSRFLTTQGVGDLPEADRAAYQQMSSGAAATRLRELQDEVLAASRPGVAVPVPEEAWQAAYDATVQQQRAFELSAIDSLAAASRPYAVDVLVRLGIAGLLGLVALAVSVVVSIRIGRSLVGRLVRLRGEALELAGERLPAVVRRLQRGESVDVDAETPPLEYGRDEIGQLGHAFNEVRRTAVQSAVEEADVRRGINEVFLNIARRSQTLLHRQLTLLDRMERRETEPDELEDLYRVDHLATRMRRHAEDLVILAGAAPGRGWRNPVPLIDVVRGAISEVEDYKRIDIGVVQSSAVLGRAVGDVIHLIAELLENAASFSPPTARVQVAGEVLPHGYSVRIEDRGLGMSAEALADANRKLVEPPEFDPADSARLGLFVVAQLAARHGIRVSLSPGAHGGVTATVLIPGELVTEAPPAPARSGGGTGPITPASRQGAVPNGTVRAVPHGSGRAVPNGSAPAVNGAAVNGAAVNGAAVNGSVHGLSLDGSVPVTALPGDAPAGEPGITGPTPSTVLDGLSADGLVQRRRTVRRRTTGPAEEPAQLPPNLTEPPPITGSPAPSAAELDVDWPSGGAVPAAFREPPAVPPRIPAQRGPAPISPAGPSAFVPAIDTAPTAEIIVPPRTPQAPAPAAGAPAPAPAAGAADPAVAIGQTADGAAPADERLLPRRVRQANLAPQLRGPFVEQAEAATARSPEQVRSLMSALQQGTTRGRRAAAGLTGGRPARKSAAPPDSKRANAGSEAIAGEGDDRPGGTDKEQTAGQPTWSEAATVTFPAVDPSAAAGDGRTDEKHETHRPEKDA